MSAINRKYGQKKLKVNACGVLFLKKCVLLMNLCKFQLCFWCDYDAHFASSENKTFR